MYFTCQPWIKSILPKETVKNQKIENMQKSADSDKAKKTMKFDRNLFYKLQEEIDFSMTNPFGPIFARIHTWDGCQGSYFIHSFIYCNVFVFSASTFYCINNLMKNL